MIFSSDLNRNSRFDAPFVRTDRDNEYLIFSRITRQLQQATESNDRRLMIEAAYANNELWTALAADLSHPGNGLPDNVKAGILSLAIFSIKLGQRVLSKNDSADPLIEINTKMMKGLRGDIQL